ncbi:putative HTH-type transcriptional regulator [Halioglobus japonicus]|nr:putative HTH-type transcriptional regulator [Halioglobus japonicus]
MQTMDSQFYTRSEPILLPYYPRLVYLLLLELGYDDEQIFGGLDICADRLHDEKYRLSVEQHEQFILRVLGITQNPHFAIQMGKWQDSFTPNLALITVANSGKISKALHLITRYNKIVTRVFSIRSVEADDCVVMEIETHLEHDSVVYFSISAFVLFLDHFFLDVLKGSHLVKRVELAVSKPDGFAGVSGEFAFPMTFGHARTRVHFDNTLLDQPMKQADPQTVRLLIEMSERQLQEAEAELSFVGAVKSLLIEQIASPPKLNDAAKQLGISSRGLRRKLEQSGTSYQKVLDSVRLKMANRLIEETDAPIASIAYELGFDNASDFGRAFKKWSGQSPSSVRSGSQ